MQFRLDKEGREFHHYDDFCQLYRAEILNLNRILDALVRNGVLPSNFIISTGSQVYFTIILFLGYDEYNNHNFSFQIFQLQSLKIWTSLTRV